MRPRARAHGRLPADVRDVCLRPAESYAYPRKTLHASPHNRTPSRIYQAPFDYSLKSWRILNDVHGGDPTRCHGCSSNHLLRSLRSSSSVSGQVVLGLGQPARESSSVRCRKCTSKVIGRQGSAET